MRVQFGEFIFDSATREISRGGRSIQLAPKAFDLLQILIEERPRALPKEELRERLWPDVLVQEANLKNLVGEIRAALGDPGVIRTVHRFGYGFGPGVEPVEVRPVAGRLIDRQNVYRLKAGENVIGRDEAACAIVLNMAGVSRQHARITAAGSRYILEDLGSKNGTWRNEQRVEEPIDLIDGDHIRLGPAKLTFRSRRPARTTATVP